MIRRAAELGVRLRPHMKTAKSVDVGRLATRDGSVGVTVSTVAEAEYFAEAGFRDITYAVGIAGHKVAGAGGAAAAARGPDLAAGRYRGRGEGCGAAGRGGGRAVRALHRDRQRGRPGGVPAEGPELPALGEAVRASRGSRSPAC